MSKRGREQPLWTCPQCQRQFANQRQSHACARHTLAEHLEGKSPEVAALYHRLETVIQSLGPVIVNPEKTRIAPLADAAHRLRRIATNQQLWAMRRDDRRIYRPDVLTHWLVGPDVLEQGQLLFKPPGALLERYPCRLKIIRAAPNGQSQAQAAIGERIEAGYHLCQHGRVAQWRQQDARYQTNALGHGGNGCQCHQRFVIRIDQAIKNAQTGKRTGLGFSGPIKDKLAPHAGDGLRESKTNLHGASEMARCSSLLAE